MSAVLLPAAASFAAFHYLSHPTSKVNKKLPSIRINRVELSPNIKLHVRGRVIWLHHWINFSILLALSLIVSGGILDATITKGVLVGGILQGISFPDAARIIYNQTSTN